MDSKILLEIRDIYAHTSPGDRREFIAQHFIPTQKERTLYAEIATPVTLVDDMLSKIPCEFWTQPHRVFEPCCGKGNFVIAIFDMFFSGLSSTIPDVATRCSIIIEVCIYYADISELNVGITTQLLECHVEAKYGKLLKLKFNSYVGDTLGLDVSTKWSIPYFDAVILNPPYQKSKSYSTKSQGVGGVGGQSLWDKFVRLGLQQLIHNGFMVVVHPPSWRKPEHVMWPIITQYQIHHISMLNKYSTTKLFGANTKVDWYVVEKCEPYKLTHIHDELGCDNLIDLKLWKWLPGAEFVLISKLFDFTSQHATFDVISSSCAYEIRKSHISRTLCSTFCYPLVHTITKSGLGCLYSNTKQSGHFGVGKVILNTNRNQYPYNDFVGKYGMTPLSYGLPISSQKQGDEIIAAINRKEFKLIIQVTKWSTFQTDWKMWKYLRCDFVTLF